MAVIFSFAVIHAHGPHASALSQSALSAISVSPSNRCSRSWSNSSQTCSSGATATFGGTLTIDDRAPRQERLDEGDVAGRLHRVDLGRDRARHRATCAA